MLYYFALIIASIIGSTLFAIVLGLLFQNDDPLEDLGDDLSDDPWLAAMVDRTLRNPDLPGGR